VTALVDLPFAFESFDLETDHAALDRDDFRRGSNGRADQRCRNVANIDFRADGDPAVFEIWLMASPDAISISKIIIGVA
jgi:hypothetical protein